MEKTSVSCELATLVEGCAASRVPARVWPHRLVRIHMLFQVLLDSKLLSTNLALIEIERRVRVKVTNKTLSRCISLPTASNWAISCLAMIRALRTDNLRSKLRVL